MSLHAPKRRQKATGVSPVGFRGPGFSFSPTLLAIIETAWLPLRCLHLSHVSWPAGSHYYFATANGLTESQHKNAPDYLEPFPKAYAPYRPIAGKRMPARSWKSRLQRCRFSRFRSMPVTCCTSPAIASGWRNPIFAAPFACIEWTATEPSLLLHPLDFLGSDDTRQLDFFPAMSMLSRDKLSLMNSFFDTLMDSFSLLPMGRHAEAISRRRGLPTRTPAN